MLVVNDVHIGVERVAGTTQVSAQALRGYLLQTYAELLGMAQEVVVNGDLFDTYNIPLTDLLQTYQITAAWLAESPKRAIHLIPGNHCLSKNSANLSSFELMARLLQSQFGDRVSYIQGGAWVCEERGVYAISHVVNQAVFDMELDRVPETAKYVLLHSNFDSGFAAQTDHSLNVTREQAKRLIDNGATVIFGHEHQGRTAFGGRLIITGNPRPSSVSDCLAHGDGQLDGKKHALLLTDGPPQTIQTWCQEGNFVQVDWRFISKWEGPEKFIRVNGNASAEEAADVIKAISTFRQKSDAFVVTNAVKVAQVADADEMEVSAEDVRSVNVISMLIESLTEEQAAVVRQLMEKN
jgi:hypothetical protein